MLLRGCGWNAIRRTLKTSPVRKPTPHAWLGPKKQHFRDEFEQVCSEDDEEGRNSSRMDLAVRDHSPDSLVSRVENDINGPILPILHEWISEGKETQERITDAIKTLKSLGRYHHAFEISDFVVHERPKKLEKFHYLNHLELLARFDSIEASEEFLRKMPRRISMSKEAQDVILDNYIREGCDHDAKLVMKVMKRHGFLRTADVFNKVLALYAKKNNKEKAILLLRDMRDCHVSPNVETYEILIGMNASNGDKDGMERLYDKMLNHAKLEPTASINLSLASGYVKLGMFKEADSYLQQVVDDLDFKKDRKLHDQTITLYAAMGKIEEVDKIWMLSKEMPGVSTKSFISAIVAYEKVGQVERAEELFLQLEKMKQGLATKHYNALLKVFSERNQMRKAEKLVERMARNDCDLDCNSYHHLITGYIRSGNQLKAVETMKKMLKEEIRPSFQSMLLMLQVHAENADVEGAEEVFQIMWRECYNGNVTVYNTLLKTYLRSDKHAPRFLQRMAMDHVKPDGITFSLLNMMKPSETRPSSKPGKKTSEKRGKMTFRRRTNS